MTHQHHTNSHMKMDRNKTDHFEVLKSLWESGSSLHNISMMNDAYLQPTKSYCFPSEVQHCVTISC